MKKSLIVSIIVFLVTYFVLHLDFEFAIVLAALAVLSGCGMNEKTTCTNENKVGNITSKVTYEIEHKNNDVKKVILTYDYRDDHTDGVGTGTDGTTKDKEDNNTTNNDNKNDNTTKNIKENK